MQTEYELCYDRFVISNISHLVISAKERISLLLDFLKKRQANYDLLCELSSGLHLLANHTYQKHPALQKIFV